MLIKQFRNDERPISRLFYFTHLPSCAWLQEAAKDTTNVSTRNGLYHRPYPISRLPGRHRQIVMHQNYLIFLSNLLTKSLTFIGKTWCSTTDHAQPHTSGSTRLRDEILRKQRASSTIQLLSRCSILCSIEDFQYPQRVAFVLKGSHFLSHFNMGRI